MRRTSAERGARALLVQLAIVASLCAVAGLIVRQTAINLKARGIASGFGYLARPAGFGMAQGVLSYSPADTHARALAVGCVNTLRVTALGIALASVLGIAVGVARLSPVWILAALARAYVECVRNTPLLLQLFLWYALSHALPAPRDAWHPLPAVFLSDRGLYLPHVAWNASRHWISIDLPALAGFGFRGGTVVSPEFAVLLFGLSTYTAAFIAEIVRGGILAVDRGQVEAATALGFSRLRTLRLVVLPQALPVMGPPATAQFVGLLKNSSLAVAIGYPDLMAVTTATLNQTGQAIEAIAVAMIPYLAMSVAISRLSSW